MSDSNVIGFPHTFKSDYQVDYETPAEVNPNVVEGLPPETEDLLLLREAYDLLGGERQVQHGTPEKCLGETAKLWTWWTGFQIDAHDVAMMLMLLKTGRVKTGAYNRDDYKDGPGYWALAGRMRKNSSVPR